MPSSPSPPPPAEPRLPQSPPSVRVALALLGTLAALLLLYVTIAWLGRDGMVEALTESGLTRAEAEQFLLINSTAPLVLGLLYAVSAWGVSSHRSWARWSGVAGSVVLALLVISTMLTAGGVTVVSLLLLVLSVATATSLLAGSTRDWLAAARG